MIPTGNHKRILNAPVSGTVTFFALVFHRPMFVYLDESGDLGWSFALPYLTGGSSRYLTLAFLFVPASKRHLPKRIIKRMYQKYGWNPNLERKASSLKPNQKLDFCQKAKALVRTHKDIQLCAITVCKEGVKDHIRSDANKLYNYMIKLCILRRLAKHGSVRFVRDERSIKVQSGNSMEDYIQTELWLGLGVKTELHCSPENSENNLNLLFVDYLANRIWRSYEFGDIEYRRCLRGDIYLSHLFFSK